MAHLRHKALIHERARIKRIDKIFLRIGQIFLIVSAMYLFTVWISYRPSIEITNIAVVGTHAVDAEQVYDVANAGLGQRLLFSIRQSNSYFYPRTQIEQRIKALSTRVAYANVSFSDRHTLVATVAEYTPTFLYCRKVLDEKDNASSTKEVIPRDCYYADEHGYVYASAPEYIGYPFVAIIASSTVEGMPLSSPLGSVPIDIAAYKRIRVFVDQLARIGYTTRAITLLDRDDVRLALDTPWSLLWTTTEKPELSASNLQVLLTSMNGDKKAKNEVREIDLRFGNKIFYK